MHNFVSDPQFRLSLAVRALIILREIQQSPLLVRKSIAYPFYFYPFEVLNQYPAFHITIFQLHLGHFRECKFWNLTASPVLPPL